MSETPEQRLAALVSAWYDEHARDLPWRAAGVSPWAVLVSEVMLQQTPVSRVLPVWREWLARWPHPQDLAAEPAAEVIRAWGRLGYPRRALRLHECARALVERHDGVVPRDVDALLALPGIGSYTARAVAVFSYGDRHPVVDTNVRRFVARAVAGDADAGPPRAAADLAAVDALLPADRTDAARASIAFMELGALICTARGPRCADCPVYAECGWQRAGRPAATGPARKVQKFAGTDRQVRGLIMAVLRDATAPVPRADLDTVWPDATQRERALSALVDDGLVHALPRQRYALPT
ncbi:MAG TPA: A/G-specific adenine glycosylase [Actinocatenispora sp.]